jgi:hypothetical protein
MTVRGTAGDTGWVSIWPFIVSGSSRGGYRSGLLVNGVVWVGWGCGRDGVRLIACYKGLVLRRLSCVIHTAAIDPSIDVRVVHCDIW